MFARSRDVESAIHPVRTRIVVMVGLCVVLQAVIQFLHVLGFDYSTERDPLWLRYRVLASCLDASFFSQVDEVSRQ
jgi:hypothetical protein